MDAYIKAGGLPDYYRCEVANKTNTQWHAEGEPNMVFGIICIVLGIICEILYIPCIIVFLQRDLFSLPVYKLLLFITIFDMSNLISNMLLMGVLLIEGAVYCTHPTFIYIWGCFQVASWCGCCIGCFFLVLTRFCDVIWPNTYSVLFSGKRIIYTIVLMCVYVVIAFFYCRPTLFNSKIKAWIFNPMIYARGVNFNEYVSPLVITNNLVTVSLTLFLGVAFFISFWYKMKNTFEFKMDKKQKQMMAQSILLSVNTFIDALIFVSFQFVQVGELVTIAGLVTWQLSSVSGIFVFYVKNKTVRNRIFQLFKSDKRRIDHSLTAVKKTTENAAPARVEG